MSTVPYAGSQRASPSSIAGKYRVIRFLGAGAMGSVHEVQDESGKHLAAKLFAHVGAGSEGDAAIARFLREASATAFVSHPNVVAVSDVGLDPELGSPFYLMELLHGADLGGVLDRLGALHPVTAVRIVLQACRGLEAAHAKGIVHRDVKPSNLFLHQEASGSIRVKVCDFGIAKWSLLGSALTQSGAMLGTPLYMAPEQATDPKRVDHRADVWSLGMTLYHALAGRAAYERVGSFLQLVSALDREDTPSIQDIAPWVEPRLAAIVHGTLVRDCGARCPSAAALGDALEALLGGARELQVGDLVPIPDVVRAIVAPRAKPPRRWSDVASSAAPFEETLDLPLADALPVRLARSQYKITRMIGRGGMAVVYQATAKDGTEVAVKFIQNEDTSTGTEARRRFVREGKALQEISSPYVVRIFEAATAAEDGVPFLVMELLRGTDLAHLVRQWGAVEPKAIVRLFVQICEGLAAAHDKGIVHRDVKPANLFLHELPDGTAIPKVCDFGIAKRPVADKTEPTLELTRTGGMVGSPVYMSPEQARNAKDVDARTDVWGVGICLWEALTGRKPWESCASLGELILAICTQQLPPIQEFAPWIEPGLADAVQRCLQADPSRRWPTMRALAEALEPHAARESRVLRSSVVPVSQALREHVAPLAASSASAVSVSRATVPSPRPGLWIYVAVGGALAATAALGFVATRPHEAPAATAASPTVIASETVDAPSPEAYVATGILRVPSQVVRVLVDGASVVILDGGVTLQGTPGASFAVEVSDGTESASSRVVIDAEGRLVPNELELPAAPARPTARPRTDDAAGTASPGSMTGVDAAPAPARSSRVPAPTTTIAPDEEWR